MIVRKDEKFKLLFESFEIAYYSVMVKLLTKEEISEYDIDALYQLLIELGELFEDEKYIPKELTGLLFKLYMTAEQELSLTKPAEKPMNLFVAYLQNYIGKIFGE